MVEPTFSVRLVQDGLAATLKSRTFSASQVDVRPEAEMRRPLVAIQRRRSVLIVTRTDGLDAVTNGSPWLGRLNGARG